jgi:hypothetical protein
LSVAVFASSAARAQPAQAPEPVVRGISPGARATLVLLGAGLFAITYVPLCAAARGAYCIPVAGPVVGIARDPLRNEEPALRWSAYSLLATAAVMQAAGLGLVAFGLTAPSRHVVAAAIAPGAVGLSFATRF